MNDTAWGPIFAAACAGKSYHEALETLLPVVALRASDDVSLRNGIEKARTFLRMEYPDDAFRARCDVVREALSEPDDHDGTTGSTIVSAAEFFSERDDLIESLWGDGLLIPGGGYLIVGGEGGVGKTIILSGLFLSLAAGLSSFLGFDLPGEETPVLILEAEGSRPKFRERILQIGDSYGINIAKLPVFFHKRDAMLSIEALGPMIAASEAKAVLLDPIGRFHDTEENSNTEWRRAVTKPLARLSDEFGCAFALSDHYVKPSEMRQNRHKLRGASAKFDDCGAALRLEYGAGGKASRVLFADRVRDGGLPDPDRLALSIDVAGGFVKLDPAASPEVIRDAAPGDQEAQDKILIGLRKAKAFDSDCALSRSALASLCGMGRSGKRFRDALSGLAAQPARVVVEEATEAGGADRVYLAPSAGVL